MPPFKTFSETSRQAAKIPWLVKHYNLYKIYVAEDSEEDTIRGTLLAAVNVTGYIMGDFRWTLGGKKIIEVNVSAGDVTNITGASEFTLKIEMRPEDVMFRPNLSSGDWEDLADLVAKGQVIATRGDEDDGHEFLGKIYASQLT